MVTAVTATGAASVRSSQFTSASARDITTATNRSAAAVAYCGIQPASGEKNSASRKQIAVTTEARPVRPPAVTPAALSIYEVVLDVPSSEPMVVAEESAINACLRRGILPS